MFDPSFNPSSYPHTYQLKPWKKLLWLILAVDVTATAAAIPWLPGPGDPLLAFTFITCVALWSIVAAWGAVTGKLVLYADRLEFYGILAVRHVARSNIATTFGAETENGSFKLGIRLKDGKSYVISVFGKGDDALFDWFEDFPNEDTDRASAEAEALESAVATNSAFGATIEEREINFNRYVTWGNRIAWVCQGFGLWAFLYPKPYMVCVGVVMALPAVATGVALLTPGRWTVDENVPGRLNLSALVTLPVLALVVRTLYDVQQVHWTTPLAAVAILTLAIYLVILKIEGRLEPTKAWAPLLMTGLYVWAATLLLNQMLETADPSVVPLEVVGKRSSGEDHYLNLAPWEGRTREDDYKVSARLYDRLKVGNTVCVHVYPGRFGWAHYDVAPCPTAEH